MQLWFLTQKAGSFLNPAPLQTVNSHTAKDKSVSRWRGGCWETSPLGKLKRLIRLGPPDLGHCTGPLAPDPLDSMMTHTRAELHTLATDALFSGRFDFLFIHMASWLSTTSVKTTP